MTVFWYKKRFKTIFNKINHLITSYAHPRDFHKHGMKIRRGGGGYAEKYDIVLLPWHVIVLNQTDVALYRIIVLRYDNLIMSSEIFFGMYHSLRTMWMYILTFVSIILFFFKKKNIRFKREQSCSNEYQN